MLAPPEDLGPGLGIELGGEELRQFESAGVAAVPGPDEDLIGHFLIGAAGMQAGAGDQPVDTSLEVAR